jgi:hypothetical protein
MLDGWWTDLCKDWGDSIQLIYKGFLACSSSTFRHLKMTRLSSGTINLIPFLELFTKMRWSKAIKNLSGESFVCYVRNTRSKLVNILFHLIMTIFNFLHFWYVSQAANKLKKNVQCFICKIMLKWRDFRLTISTG